MKRCPTCQKEFPDSLRFCQTDGTPLVEAAENNNPASDPYKTIVGGIQEKDDDILQIHGNDDPMKTVVSSSDAPKFDMPSSSGANEPPKAAEPGMNAPSFGDLSSGSAGSAPPSSSPFDEPPKFDAPSPADANSSPFGSYSDKNDSPFGAPSNQSGSSPFGGASDKTPPPPYKDADFSGGQQPYNQSPFSQSQTPFGASNEPFNQPFQQNDWTPPPAPVAAWQDQGLGANTPFQSPVVQGEDKTLAIVSLVCGILSLTCCGLLTGIPALITGYMAKNNVDNNPQQYGGRGMALAGMIMGGVSIVFTILYLIFIVVGGVLR